MNVTSSVKLLLATSRKVDHYLCNRGGFPAVYCLPAACNFAMHCRTSEGERARGVRKGRVLASAVSSKAGQALQ